MQMVWGGYTICEEQRETSSDASCMQAFSKYHRQSAGIEATRLHTVSITSSHYPLAEHTQPDTMRSIPSH